VPLAGCAFGRPVHYPTEETIAVEGPAETVSLSTGQRLNGLNHIARLRLVKPKRRKGYKQEITEHQRLQLDAEVWSRGVDASETEEDLLLHGASLPSGAGLRLFYRNQRLQEDDKWRQWY